MAGDFHAHHPKSAARTLISCRADDLERYPLASLELHPWFLSEHFEPFDTAFRSALRRATALGEIGLDRLRGPAFAVQEEFFDALLALAHEEKKPVVAHCVRAAAELQAAWKRYPKLRILYHGFRGKPEFLEELRQGGFYLSLGAESLNNAPLLAHLKRTGLERVGFETDDSPEPIESLIAHAAEALGINPGALEEQTDRTFEQFLGLGLQQ